MQIIEQLQQLAPLAAAATPGEWHNSAAYPYNDGQVLSYLPDRRNTSIVANCRTSNFYAKEAPVNAAFIAAARNVLTPENLKLIIGLLGNMESSFEANRVLAKRQVEIDDILRRDLFADEALEKIYRILNPTK